MIYLILQNTCNRICYFTNDITFIPFNTPKTWNATCTVLPDGITLENAWSWKFDGETFTQQLTLDPDEVPSDFIDDVVSCYTLQTPHRLNPDIPQPVQT